MGIAQVGGGAAQGKAVTVLTTTSYTSTKGNRIVVTVHVKGTVGPSSVIDTVMSAYSLLAAVNNGTTDRTELWGAVSKASGSNAVTVSFASGTTCALCVEEYSSSGGFGNTGTNTGSSTSPSVTVTAQETGNWIVGGAGGNGTGTFTMAAPNVQRQTANTSGGSSASNMGGDIGDKPATAPGAVTLAATISASEVWTMVAVELRFSILVSQPITAGTDILKTVTKILSQPVGVLTTSSLTLTVSGKTLTVTQPITIAAAIVKTILKVVSQPVAVGTSIVKTVSKPVTQPITVTTSVVKTVSKPVSQPVTVLATFTRTVSYIRSLTQPATVLTQISKVVTKPLSQPVSVLTTSFFLRIRFLTATQPVTVLAQFTSVAARVLSTNQTIIVFTRGTFTIPSAGPKILNVTQPIMVVITTNLGRGFQRGFFWGPSPPLNPVVSTIWMDTVAVVLKKWNGTAWVAAP